MSIRITPYKISRIDSYEIKRGLNRHDEAMIQGEMSAEEYLVYEEMADSSTVLSLFYKDEKNKETLLFAGVLKTLNVCEEGGAYRVEMHLCGITQVMDYVSYQTDYQNEAKKSDELIGQLMKSYESLGYSIQAEPFTIRHFLMQHEETDYAFIKRMLSEKQEPVFTRMKGKQGQVCFGKPKESEGEQAELTEYEIRFGEFPAYVVELDEFLDLGEAVKLQNKKLYVYELEQTMKDGRYRNQYVLCNRNNFIQSRYYNCELTGISLDGTITARRRDKVQIQLNATGETPQAERRWFSYASPAASSDGSGWYCMPEEGEEIRLFFPTEDEEEAYVISAIKSGGSGGSGAGAGALAAGGESAPEQNTEDKILSNDQGQMVSFTAQGVAMNCADNAAAISLSPDGTIEVTAMTDVSISSEELVSLQAEENLSLTALGNVQIINAAGSDITVSETINVHGNRIKNNG